MTVTKTEAKALFTELKGVARRGEALVVKIVETRAWEPLGYPTLAAAWSEEIGDDIVIFSQKVRKAIIREFARTNDLESLPEMYGITGALKTRLIEQYAFGVPHHRIGQVNYWGEELEAIYSADEPPEGWERDRWEYQRERFLNGETTEKWLSDHKRQVHKERARQRKEVHRRSTMAALPSKPTTVHVVLGEADYERMTRVLNAAGKFQTEELKRVIMAHVDRLESELTVSV